MDLDLLGKTIKKVRIRKELIVMLFSIAIFLFVLYMVFSGNKPTEQDVPNYAELNKDESAKYKEYIDNANSNVKNLAENNQLKEIKYFKDLIVEKEYKKRNDPFIKSF